MSQVIARAKDTCRGCTRKRIVDRAPDRAGPTDRSLLKPALRHA